MSRRGVLRSLLSVIAVMAIWSGSLLAQEGNATSARAARLSFLQGKVEVRNADNTGAGEAQINQPLFEGQQITTGDDGQAEVEFEDGSIARLTPQSAVTLVRMDSDQGRYLTQIALNQGMGYFELRVAGQNGYYVTAGAAGVTPVENATFRLSLDQQPVELAVLQGSVHVEREGGYSTNVHRGEQFEGDSADATRYFLSKLMRQDSWDNWNEERDQAAAAEAAQRTQARDDYAQDSGYGWSDLDANGSWYDLPGYGRVWQPPVAVDAGWDPYGYGSWVWYPGPGYVWVSGYGWGWTPYRCGNWSYWDGFGWGWIPAGGCRRWGWGGPGVVWTVNVINPPRVWHPIQRPVLGPPGPGGVHPIIPVRHGPIPVHPVGRPQPRPVLFGGKQIEPLRPISGPYTPRGGSAVGASLQKDFPVRDRQPVMGVVRSPRDGDGRPTSPAGLRDNGATPTPIQAQPMPYPVTPAGGWRTVTPGQNNGQQPQPVNKPAPVKNGGEMQRPTTNPRPEPGHVNQVPVQTQPQPQPRPVERPSQPRMDSPAPRPVQPTPQPMQQPRPNPPQMQAPRPAPAPASRPMPAPPK